MTLLFADHELVNVKDSRFKAAGDGIADDTAAIQSAFDHCYGPASSPHGVNYYQNRRAFFPPGHYKISAPLLLSKVQGGSIIGSGRFATTIENVANGGTVLLTNGMGYSTISGLALKCGAGGVCLDLDYDGVGPSAALQANSIEDIFCDGSAGGNSIGVRVGQSGFMGSECIFKMLHTQGCGLAGVVVNNFNALQHQFYGGQDQGCGVGIWATVGSVPIISGRGFQLQSECDIKTSGGQHNAMSIVGCRTESSNFVKNDGGQSLDISACIQTSGTGQPGNFLSSTGGVVNVRSCEADGKVFPRFWCNLSIVGHTAKSFDWLTLQPDQLWFLPSNTIAANIELRNIIASEAGNVVQIFNQRKYTTDGLTITTEGR